MRLVHARVAAVVLRVLLLACLGGGVARADANVDAARDAYLSGDFKTARKRLERAEATRGISDDTRARICWYRALVALGEGNNAEATRWMDALLDASPLHEPDPREAPPTTRALFQQRLALHQQERAPVLGDPQWTGEELGIPVTARAHSVGAVVVWLRPVGMGTFERVPLAVRDGRAQGPVATGERWQQAREKGGWEMALEAQRANGTPLARKATQQEPLVVDAPPAPAVPPQPVAVVQPPQKPTPPLETAGPAPAPDNRGPGPAPGASPLRSGARTVLGGLTLATFGAAGLMLLAGVVAWGVCLAAAGFMMSQPVPRRQSWWPAVLLTFQTAFWTGVVLGGVWLVSTGLAVTGTAVWWVLGTSE